MEIYMNTYKSSIYNSWPLYLSVALLILNDHIFKEAYPSWLTGKLSDFSGIFLIILFLRSVGPDHARKITTAVIVLFAFWKSTYSQPLINSINMYSDIKIGRVVDLTDLMALTIIPIAHHVFENSQKFNINLNIVGLLKIPVITVAVLAITGTALVNNWTSYTIKQKSQGQQIDRVTAISIIKRAVVSYGLVCVKCDPSEENGEFQVLAPAYIVPGGETSMKYTFLKNNRGIKFNVVTLNPHAPRGYRGKDWNLKRRIEHTLAKHFNNEYPDLKFTNSPKF
jgi:hypothetical protein